MNLFHPGTEIGVGEARREDVDPATFAIGCGQRGEEPIRFEEAEIERGEHGLLNDDAGSFPLRQNIHHSDRGRASITIAGVSLLSKAR